MSDTLIIETGEPVVIKYHTHFNMLPVKLFTFDSSDDPNIPEKTTTSILTCARQSYPELRPYFAQAFTAFVARINLGMNGGGYYYWNDYLCNPNNPAFQSILAGNMGTETELFIIPLQRNKRKRFIPMGGVNFVLKAYMNRSRAANGRLNLIAGDSRIRFDGLYLDKYGTEKAE